eukprot:scaffold141789_cov32-Tisochrysis_lutea.AAC.6
MRTRRHHDRQQHRSCPLGRRGSTEHTSHIMALATTFPQRRTDRFCRDDAYKCLALKCARLAARKPAWCSNLRASSPTTLTAASVGSGPQFAQQNDP